MQKGRLLFQTAFIFAIGFAGMIAFGYSSVSGGASLARTKYHLLAFPIRRKLSPEQVCAYLHKHHQITLHHSTVYRYLRQDKSNGGTLWQHLRICSKPYRKRYGSTWTRGKVPNRVGIDQKSALLTLVERATRYTIICKLDSLKAEDTARAAVRALKAHKDRVHTITMDNGKEFYQHTKIAKALKAENRPIVIYMT